MMPEFLSDLELLQGVVLIIEKTRENLSAKSLIIVEWIWVILQDEYTAPTVKSVKVIP